MRGEDIYYTKGNNFSKINNVLPDNFTNKIICGDSENVLKLLPDNCIDLIFTSPPYNFGMEYSDYNDDLDWEEYFNKLYRVFDESIRVLKYGGRIVIDTKPAYNEYIPIHHIISNYFIQKKMIWRSEIIWDMNHYSCKVTAWGSWKSPSSPYLKTTWEYLEVFCKGNLVHEGKSEDADITDEEFKNWTTVMWHIAPEGKMKEYGHPAMFPEELARRVIKLFSFKGDTVCDPFNGVGTTTVVANRLGRKYIGIDMSEQYCQVARRRLELEDVLTLF